ncbi:hypothetical protein VTK73DRAFT_9620 [Phialemonium thermophilum]|uniref:2-(3-amino-3-carboxypropyl)histidine synthase subunit 2 n=1 Tax=Phialemonium thermophilum TaxID=223376 RepID=A0ABR3XJN4_9PEZI
MAGNLTAAPALSTPAEQILGHIKPEVPEGQDESQTRVRSNEELRNIYEIERTAREIRAGKRRRIALQFPDSMLRDAPWVVEALKSELKVQRRASVSQEPESPAGHLEKTTAQSGGASESGATANATTPSTPQDQIPVPTTSDALEERIYVLADTSYSSCCVDEIAAEHAEADVVVHYGRSCLSPTSRLPVIYVFTKHQLDEEAAVAAFEQTFSCDTARRVVLMADVTFQDHVPSLATAIRERGYTNLLSTRISRNPLGKIPNRLIIDQNGTDVTSDTDLHDYSVFHISSPPTALFLALSSRVKDLHIFPTHPHSSGSPASLTISSADTARRLLGRRYARLLSLATAGIIGILVNTLSVTNYLSTVDSIRRQIAAAGKKSYTVVVGKLNPAKLANFAEIDGWVVVGCWESSLVEDDAGFYQPVITPFELSIALAGDEARIWDGTWWGGIEAVKEAEAATSEHDANSRREKDLSRSEDASEQQQKQDGAQSWEQLDDDESEPPEFDLRTGKLVSRSRPMRTPVHNGSTSGGNNSAETSTQAGALSLRPKSDLATVNGVVSPGAEFLRSQRTWQGLGSDFDGSERSAVIEEGRSGVARGYTVGTTQERR